MHFMQIESVLQTKNRSEPAKNRFSVALEPSLFAHMKYGSRRRFRKLSAILWFNYQ